MDRQRGLLIVQIGLNETLADDPLRSQLCFPAAEIARLLHAQHNQSMIALAPFAQLRIVAMAQDKIGERMTTLHHSLRITEIAPTENIELARSAIHCSAPFAPALLSADC